MKLSTLNNISTDGNVCLFVLEHAEKSIRGKWKRFVTIAKAVIYTVMVFRIVAAIYVKVNSSDE